MNGERLRFDFSHFAAPRETDLDQIERLVNEKIVENSPVKVTITSPEKARQMGALALFGEKYGNQVRVIGIGDYSLELCGGTHVEATGAIGMLKLTSEGSVGAGLRRIEAVTGLKALEYVNTLEETLLRSAAELKTRPGELPERIISLLTEIKEKDGELKNLGRQLARLQVEGLVARARDISGVKMVAEAVRAKGVAELRSLTDILRERLPSGIILLGTAQQDRVDFVCSVSSDLIPEGFHAGRIVKEVAKVVGGGGGGRPDMAQAGGRNPARLPEALDRGMKLVQEQL